MAVVSAAQAPFPIVRIEGAPYARGVSYGEQARERIERSLAFYVDNVVPTLEVTFADLCAGVMAHLERWRAADAEIIEEIEGIAAGSGRSVAEILFLNTRGAFVMPPSDQRDAAAKDDGCSSFAVLPRASRSGHMLTGQNWDYLAGIRDTVILLHVRPDVGPTQLMILEAGQVGRHGMNSAGVAMHANGLGSRMRNPAAIPSTFMRRRILRAPGITEAINAAITPPRAGSTNLVITHRDGFAIDLETLPDTIRWLYPTDGWLFHTNHFVAEIPPELAASYAPSADSLLRYGRAIELMDAAARGGGIGHAELTAILSDHVGNGMGLCSHLDPAAPAHEQWCTVATVISDLTAGVMSVSAGPPCEHTFVDVSLETGDVLQPTATSLPG
jgi:isopenicillin-N N-acyltransferase-like protein